MSSWKTTRDSCETQSTKQSTTKSVPCNSHRKALIEKTHPRTNNVTQEDVVQYFANGQHCFVACDDEVKRDAVVHTAKKVLSDRSLECIAGDSNANLEEFGISMVAASNGLVSSIGAPTATGRLSLSELLHETMLRFREREHQGFLVVNHVDGILALQHSFEIEAAFREIMQRYNDVAILWIGSSSAILDIGQSDRPFYLSFPIFWLNQPSD